MSNNFCANCRFYKESSVWGIICTAPEQKPTRNEISGRMKYPNIFTARAKCAGKHWQKQKHWFRRLVELFL